MGIILPCRANIWVNVGFYRADSIYSATETQRQRRASRWWGGGRKRSLCKTTQFAYILSVLKSREIWRNSMAGWCFMRSVSRPRHVDCDDRQHHQDRDGRKPDRRPAVRHAGVHRRATRSTLSSGGAGGRRGQLPQGAQNSRVKIVYH